MYISPGEKEPFETKYALDFEFWRSNVKIYRLKCKCSSFYIPQLNDYYDFEADFIDNKIKFNIDEKEFELMLEEDDYDSIYKFFIDPIDKQSFINECINMVKNCEGIRFGTNSEEVRPINSYYDIFLDILLDDFPFDEYDLNAFCSDFLGHFGTYYKTIGIRKADINKGIIPGPKKLVFPDAEY